MARNKADAEDIEIGKLVRAARKNTKENYSVYDTAEFLEISPAMVSMYENGKNPIPRNRLKKMAKLYKVKWQKLLPENNVQNKTAQDIKK